MNKEVNLISADWHLARFTEMTANVTLHLCPVELLLAV